MLIEPSGVVALVVKNLPIKQETYNTRVSSQAREDSLEEGMAIHATILAKRNPWIEEPGSLQSTGFQRVGHKWTNLACMHSTPWTITDPC